MVQSNEPDENEENGNNSTKINFQWVRLDEPINEENLIVLTPSDVIYMLIGGLLSKNEVEVQHNLHIANHGYTYEDNLLYFPMYPLMIKGLTNACNWFAQDIFYIGRIHL